jgi:hypothetical protein
MTALTEGVDDLAAIPSAGAGQVRLDLLRVAGEAGARERFEHLITDVVKVFHPTARAVQANPGDWGIDTFVGVLSRGTVGVWQSKYFVDGIGNTQKADIRESFKSVCDAADARGFKIASWTLAIPVDMDGPTTQWWDRWKKRTENATGITIELWPKAHIEHLLIKEDFADVRHQYFGYAPGEPVDERDVADPEDWTVYDTALFIRQLQVAGITEDQPARRAFFNAEVMTRDVMEREAPNEVGALRTVEATLHQMWHTRYESHRAGTDDSDIALPGLYPDVMQAVESYHRDNPSRELKDTLVHRSGLVHHLVEGGGAGWVVNYLDIAGQHQPEVAADA